MITVQPEDTQDFERVLDDILGDFPCISPPRHLGGGTYEFSSRTQENIFVEELQDRGVPYSQ